MSVFVTAINSINGGLHGNILLAVLTTPSAQDGHGYVAPLLKKHDVLNAFFTVDTMLQMQLNVVLLVIFQIINHRRQYSKAGLFLFRRGVIFVTWFLLDQSDGRSVSLWTQDGGAHG